MPRSYTVPELRAIWRSVPDGTHMEPFYSRKENPTPKQSVKWFLSYIASLERKNPNE